MNNTRFAISLHILTLLAKAKGELLSSDYIAGSININPAIVRKEIINLRKYGLVKSKAGKYGGSYLARPAEKITLSEVYKAVRQTPLLGPKRNDVNPDCPVGRQINKHLDVLYSDVEEALIKQLGLKTLAYFSRQFV